MYVKGYYHSPSIYNDKIFFISDDELWSVSKDGGNAVQLTHSVGHVLKARVTPDGKNVVFISDSSGRAELYIVSVNGGKTVQLTYNSIAKILGWKSSSLVYISTFANCPNRDVPYIQVIDINTGDIKEKFKWGPIQSLVSSNGLEFVIERGMGRGGFFPESAYWKGYKGGTQTTLWVKKNKKDKFQQILKDQKCSVTHPIIYKSRIFYLTDESGVANIYSCSFAGKNIKQHTFNKQNDFYVRNISLNTVGDEIIYHSAGEIFIYNINSNKSHKVDISINTSSLQTSVKYEPFDNDFSSVAYSSKANQVSLVTRGRLFKMPAWSGAAVNLEGVQKENINSLIKRFKNVVYSFDGKLLVAAFAGEDGSDKLMILDSKNHTSQVIVNDYDFGKIWELKASPSDNKIAIVNNRNEVSILNIKNSFSFSINKILNNEQGIYANLQWSPDGRYLVYTKSMSGFFSKNHLAIYDFKAKKNFKLSSLVIANDIKPCFDNSGRFLVFISAREFLPKFSEAHFNISYPFALRPYLISLRPEYSNPFDLALSGELIVDNKENNKKKDKNINKDKDDSFVKMQEIVFNGIEKRIIPIPLELGGYVDILMTNDKLFYLKSDINRKVDNVSFSWKFNESYSLYQYSFVHDKEELISKGVSSFHLSPDRKEILFVLNNKEKEVRVLKVESISPASFAGNEKRYSKECGYIDLSRITLKISPSDEWKQLFVEAWILQKEHFWNKSMSGVDWNKVFQKYFKLLPLVHSRGELDDILWEMYGELGTSHNYVFLGDYHKKKNNFSVGQLGANLRFDRKNKCYVITYIPQGDSWDFFSSSALSDLGVNLQKDDQICAINGQTFTQSNSIFIQLENLANKKVVLTVKRKDKKIKEEIVVKLRASSAQLYYRDWVDKNREYVHKNSKGKLGYIHIPDMSMNGYSEFLRSLLQEHIYEGMVIDVRNNGGGFVSQLILKELCTRSLGFDMSRWLGVEEYPKYSITGPMVCLINEGAGSDGDIFPHVFKALKLGKLIGKRTWGGVIGIDGKYSLIDGTIATQSEYSFCFNDVGYGVENHGVDPDIELDITVEDWMNNLDPQLDCAIEVALKELGKLDSLERSSGKKNKNTLKRLTRKNIFEIQIPSSRK